MDYKEKYQEAKSWIESIYPDLSHELQMQAEAFFPELYDEKMRAMAIKAVYAPEAQSCIKSWGINPDDVIAWLEKQGVSEHNKIQFEKQGEQKVDKCEGCNNIKGCIACVDGSEWAHIIEIPDKVEPNDYNSIDPHFGKAVDKVEPKFKVGDWITCEELNTAKIINVDGDRYEVEFIDGNKGFPHIDYIDRMFHLWTIQDAKDGDVLFVKPTKNLGVQLIIFGGIDFDNRIKYYCRFLNNRFSINDGLMGYEHKYFLPATKEQRDILFSKMKEAGYVWNEKELKLEKI